MEFWVVAHMDFLVMGHKICENCYVHAWNKCENIRVSTYFNYYYYEKNSKKILFAAFISKITVFHMP